MKKSANFLLALIIVFLCGCSGSGTYRGHWKATDSKGGKFEITFEAKNLSVKDSAGDKSNFEYTQNSVSIENSITTYGIQLGDGRKYLIHFPFANDESRAIIEDAGGNPIYIISRGEYTKYEDIYKLK